MKKVRKTLTVYLADEGSDKFSVVMFVYKRRYKKWSIYEKEQEGIYRLCFGYKKYEI